MVINYLLIYIEISYATFSISHSNDVMLIFLTIAICILTLAILIGVFIFTLLNIRGTSTVPLLGKIINIGIVLITGIFYIPGVNVFISGLQCLTYNMNPSYLPKINCRSKSFAVIMIFGLIFLVILILFTFIVRMFLFNHNHKKGGIFTL